MIFFPLIVFSLLLFHIYKRNGVDLSFCMMGIYTFSSLLSIFLYFSPKQEYTFDYSTIEVGVIPTILYCAFVWLSVYPFYKYNSNKERELSIRINERLFNTITYVYVFVFFLIWIIFYDQIGIRLVLSNMNDMRQDFYGNEDFSVTSGMSFYQKLVAYGALMLGGCSYFMIVFFFYSISVLNRGKVFNSLLFLSTTTPIVSGILNMDRSSTVYWFFLMLLGYFLFRKHIKKENKKFLFGIGLVLVVVLAGYFLAVTIARFGESDSGASGGLLDYAGQSFLNYCYIWDKLSYDKVYWGSIMPITNLLTGFAGSFKEFAYEMYQKTGVDVNVFFSTSGFFLVHLGHIAAILVPFLIYAITNKVVRLNNRKTIGLNNYIYLFLFAAIPQCGLISYFYTSDSRAANFWIFIIIASIITKKKNVSHINRR